MYNICSADPVVKPSSVAENYPEALEAVVLKALEKDRTQRYSSCDEMLRDLDSLPAELRVGSNSDVGDFVVELMGSRRDELKRRIDEAIARVEANPTGTWPGIDGSGSRVTIHPQFGTQELSGVGSGLHPQAARNRIIGVLGLAALVFSGVLLAMTVINRPTPRELDAQEPPIVEVEPAEPAPALPPAMEAEGTVIDPDSLPSVEPEESEEAEAENKKPPRPRAPRPAKKSKDSWKYDSGF